MNLVPFTALTSTIVGQVLFWVGWTFLILLFARVVFENVQMLMRDFRPSGPLLLIVEAVYTVTDPAAKLFRRFIPPLRLGNVQLDLSLMALLFVVWIVTYVIAPSV